LVKNGYHVSLIGLGQPGIEQRLGLKVITVAERRFRQKRSVLKRIAELAAEEQADIYHCLDPWTLAIGFGLKRSRPGVRLIYESSEWFPRMFRDRDDLALLLRWLGWLAIERLEARAVKEADAIVETNETRAQRFIRRGCSPVIIPNYPPRENLPAPWPRRNPWFAYTGLISRHRGFDKLLEALVLVVRKHPEVRLRIVGLFDPRDDIETRTRTFIRQAGIEGNLEFLSWLPYDQLFQSLVPCLAGVILFQPERGNDYTGLPNKLFEFMGSGLAVIASAFPEMARVVRETGCGWLVDPTRPDSIARAMTDVLDNPEETLRRGQAGRQAVGERYHWGVAEAELLALYQRLLR